MQKVIAEISVKALQANARRLKKISGARLCAVVKADAYGHGAIGTVAALSGIADYYAVALLEEALTIKTAAAGKEIWILTPPTDEETAYLAASNAFVLCVADEASAKLVCGVANRYGVKVKVQLKVNTGMNRYGLGLSSLGRVCKRLLHEPLVEVTGIYSHLYAHTRWSAEKQRVRFERATVVCRKYFPKALRHLSATYGALLGKEFAFDAVRIGLGLYGYLPEGEYEKTPTLKRVMKLYAECVCVRGKSYGGAGYGEGEKALKRSCVLRIGYADGCGHENAGGYKGLRGQASDFCMDACIVEKRWKRGRKVLVMDDADEVAKARGTISYEVLCLAGMRAEKKYL